MGLLACSGELFWNELVLAAELKLIKPITVDK